MKGIARFRNHEHKLNVVERSESPLEPTRAREGEQDPIEWSRRRVLRNDDMAQTRAPGFRQAPNMGGDGAVRSRRQSTLGEQTAPANWSSTDGAPCFDREVAVRPEGSSRLGSAALPAPSIGIRCRRPERIDHGRPETHRRRASCDSNAARRRATERSRTRLASQLLYARLERRECFSTLWTGTTPRSGVGPAKTGVGCCLVMPAVHRPAICLAQRFVRSPE